METKNYVERETEEEKGCTQMYPVFPPILYVTSHFLFYMPIWKCMVNVMQSIAEHHDHKAFIWHWSVLKKHS